MPATLDESWNWEFDEHIRTRKQEDQETTRAFNCFQASLDVFGGHRLTKTVNLVFCQVLSMEILWIKQFCRRKETQKS